MDVICTDKYKEVFMLKRRKWFMHLMIVVMLLASFPYGPAAATAANASSAAFEFNTDGDAEGWMAFRNGVGSYDVSGGALHVRLNGIDPNWFAPKLNLQTTKNQSLVIRMKADNGSTVAFYYETDLHPGLSESKRIVFGITPDGQYHEYQINLGSIPQWEGVVGNFRMDLEPATSVPANVSIDYIRIAEKSSFSFEFKGSTDGWSSAFGLTPLSAGPNAITATVTGEDPQMVSQSIGKPSGQLGIMKLRARVTAGSSFTFYFTTDSSPQFSENRVIRVPAQADGQFHEYIVNFWEHPLFEGEIGMLRMDVDSPDDMTGAEWEIDYMRFTSVIPPVFDWSEDGNAQGWAPYHSFSPFVVSGGELQTQVTGGDPYLGVSNIEGVIGERDKTLNVRMRSTGGKFVSIFFTTETAPGFSEARRIDFTIESDGALKDYSIAVGDHPEWKGKITGIRFDLEGDAQNASFALDEVRFVSSPAGAEISVKRTRPSLNVGEEAEISAEFNNTGGKAMFNPQAELVLSPGLELVAGTAATPLTDILPGQTQHLTWKVRGTGAAPSQVDVRLSASGVAYGRSVPLPVFDPVPAVSPNRPTDARAVVDAATGQAMVENANVRVVFPHSTFGYGQYQVYMWADGGWQLMATTQPFASAIVRQSDGGDETVGFYPDSARVVTGEETASGQAGIAFQGQSVDREGRTWDYRFTFKLKADDEFVRVIQQVTADRAANLMNMTGPVLTVGEGSFGSAKDEALFPGLEWLTGNESSSNKLDTITPEYLRLVPHPYKITIPLMAVRSGNKVVSLMWDPLQLWDGTNSLPAAKFASPNWVENQNNHVLGLSALSVPTWVKENKEVAEHPYPLQAGQPIELQAQIAAITGDSVTKAVELYMKANDLPKPPEVNDFAGQVDLGLDAFLRTYWVPEEKGWRHVNIESWGSAKFTSNLVILRLLGISDPSRKQAAEDRIQEVLDDMPNKGQLGNPDGHVLQWPAPFYFGYMNESLDTLHAYMQARINSQDASGAWLFHNGTTPNNPPLGQDGEPMMGATALNAKNLLKYAGMTGDQAAKEAGMKGLNALETMGDIPRAGQTWEVPVHTPDILAAANAVGAYVEAYKLTGDEQYIHKAVKWAKTGLPFVYTWSVPERPVMLYGSIAVFGSSAYINPWFGRPVQWNGLVYAYELLELARYDQSVPWEKVAEGIVSSGERQQASDASDPWRGGYPDSWKLVSNSRSDQVMLNPEEIVKNIFKQRALDGKGPEVDFSAIAIPGCPSSSQGNASCKETRVASIATIVDTSPSNTEHLVSFKLNYPAGETTYVLVSQREKPKRIEVNGTGLSEASNLSTVQTGWNYSASTGFLVLKVKHTAQDKVKIHY